jgi:ATP-dependent Clp protease protease subunit
MAGKKSLDAQELWLDYGVDVAARKLFWSGDVDSDFAYRCIAGLHLLPGTAPISVSIQSYGGSVDEMFAIYDAVKAFPGEVTMTVSGYACSAGCIILQAADRRLVRPNAFIMHHVGEGGYGSQHPRNLKLAQKWYDVQLRRMEEILYAKIKEKNPKFSLESFRNRHDWDHYLSATEAVEWGLADEVTEE